MTNAARLAERVAFDEPTGSADTLGGETEAWTEHFAQVVADNGLLMEVPEEGDLP